MAVRYSLLIAVCLISNLLQAQVVRFQNPVQSYNLFQSSTSLEVKAGSVSIDDLLTNSGHYQFIPTKDQPIKPYHPQLGYWFRFEIANETTDNIFLQVVYNGTEHMTIYEVAGTQILASHKLGMLEPEYTFAFLKSNLVCPTLLEKGQTHTFYVYMQGIYTTALPIFARSTYNLLEYIHISDLFYGLYYGFILLIVVYSLILYVRLRESDTLLYAIWVFIEGLQLALFRGHTNEFLWSSDPSIERYATVLAGIESIAQVQFTLAFLHLRQRAPLLYKFGVGFSFVYVVGILMNIISIQAKGYLQVDIVPPLALVRGLFSIWAGIVVFRQGFKPALYYVIGNAAFFASIFLFLVYAARQLPHTFWTYNIIHIGSGIEIILFTLTLTYKINLLKEKQDKAVQEQLRLVEANRNLVEQQNTILEEKVTQRTNQLSAQKEELQHALVRLQSTQAQLIQQEKLASLGELTAGIAHEIQNPLNFVNNFSEITVELVDELLEGLDAEKTQTITLLADDIRENLQHIVVHGRRASDIVRGMLEHTRTDIGSKQLTDLNALADEYLRLSYHALRAKNKALIIKLVTEFEPNLAPIDLVPQTFSRVLLNLYNNAFYTISQKAQQLTDDYQPTILVRTEQLEKQVRLTVHDNGLGIPESIRQKIFNPFFTTKPTGQGTGLGLSLSYDIITHGHGGRIEVQSHEGAFTDFYIYLPK